jgi:hypothetical protein
MAQMDWRPWFDFAIEPLSTPENKPELAGHGGLRCQALFNLAHVDRGIRNFHVAEMKVEAMLLL